MTSFLLYEYSPHQILMDFPSVRSSGIPETEKKILSLLMSIKNLPFSFTKDRILPTVRKPLT